MYIVGIYSPRFLFADADCNRLSTSVFVLTTVWAIIQINEIAGVVGNLIRVI